MANEPGQSTRIYEMKLPITWLITISIPILWAAIQLYFTVGILKETVTELNKTVSVLAQSSTDTQREISLQGYRISNLEEYVKEQKNGKH